MLSLQDGEIPGLPNQRERRKIIIYMDSRCQLQVPHNITLTSIQVCNTRVSICEINRFFP